MLGPEKMGKVFCFGLGGLTKRDKPKRLINRIGVEHVVCGQGLGVLTREMQAEGGSPETVNDVER